MVYLVMSLFLSAFGYAEQGKLSVKKDSLSSCESAMRYLPGKSRAAEVKRLCKYANVMPTCESVQGRPIYHFNRRSFAKKGKRILAMAVVHGDEAASGSVARAWALRLMNLRPRNAWRVIPILNPDGLKAKTRMNASGVDLNRNFPTTDWDRLALKRWKVKKKMDPRRYPGPNPSSEAETRCAVAHLEDFKPDFVIAIHTPLGLLDFDGPKVKRPSFLPLPWRSLGNYPGSLGRYMWKENSVPVLTIELKGSHGVNQLEKFDRLQDVSGTVAIQSGRVLKKKQIKR